MVASLGLGFSGGQMGAGAILSIEFSVHVQQRRDGRDTQRLGTIRGQQAGGLVLFLVRQGVPWPRAPARL